MRTSLVAALLCIGCSPSASVSVEPLGEPSRGEPSWSERLTLVWVNRARADPATELADCEACADRGCYGPVPPVAWSAELGHAARFHAAMLSHWSHGLSHTSPCALRADVDATFASGACDGSAGCACEGGAFACATPSECGTCSTCTQFPARVRRFGVGPVAENIALAGSALHAMHAFLTEPYDVSECGYGRDSLGRPNGHRFSILSPDRGTIGIGYVGAYMTQDFGLAAPPRGIVAGAHFPEVGPALEMRANWYDDAAPVDLRVNVDGACTRLALERGSETNGTYLADVTTTATCAHYVYEVDSPTGLVSLPPTGSYGVGCESEWSEARPPRCGCAPSCDARACGDDGCGGSCGTCSAGTLCDVWGSCVATATPDASTSGGDAGVEGDSSFAADAGLRTDASAPTAEEASAPPDGGRRRPARLLTGGCSIGGHTARGWALRTAMVLAWIVIAARRPRSR